MRIYDPALFDDLAETKQELRQWRATSLRTAAHYCERKGDRAVLRLAGKETDAETLEAMALAQADCYQRILELVTLEGMRA